MGIDGDSCFAECPDFQTPVDGRCACADTFTQTPEGACTCAGYLDLLGKSCVSECPEHQTPLEGRCACASGFALSVDGACVAGGSSGNGGGSGTRAAIVVLVCVGALEVVAAIVIFCRARGRKRAANDSAA